MPAVVLDSRDLAQPDLARSVGDALRRIRRARRLRVRQLADRTLDVATLKAAEKGRLRLSRSLLIELAGRYGLDLEELFPPRRPVEIGPGRLTIDGQTEPCKDGSLTSMLGAYLRLVDRVRTDPGPVRPLRREDVRALADRLDIPCTDVISRLADLMYADGAETRAMIELYLSGASVVGLGGSRAGLSPAGTGTR